MKPDCVIVYCPRDGMSYRAQVLQRMSDSLRVRLVGAPSEPFVVSYTGESNDSGFVLKTQTKGQPFEIVRCGYCNSGKSDDKLVLRVCPTCKMAKHQSCEERANNALRMPAFEECLSCFIGNSDDSEG
ncbi:hypothetical protein SARC_05778 [Sphaeroforma arctica JP610]|uniref:Uncharacterized protein n=1 Tax=Sphaeroforma arctica JP610 TaxID=667725 RepID=A0A0L0FYK3_9EUKA|nr:hypothetical protein SARC_05778 [Sphaeroforma arctica JP610]KNC81927.1 hypothetical protein SARC_05778 [Sphaeroforma arctica JP610]|eukprot:XP_014155829.1 hypothetical protein SARC_05778 [Sphaeroforma arctica JP610]